MKLGRGLSYLVIKVGNNASAGLWRKGMKVVEDWKPKDNTEKQKCYTNFEKATGLAGYEKPLNNEN